VAINTLPSRLRRERANGLRVVTTAHDLLPPYLFPKAGGLRTWYTKRILQQADAAILTNAADFHQVEREQWSQRAAFIPIGSNVVVSPPDTYDRELWRHKFGVQPGQSLFAYFGLLTHTKGIETILDALAHVPDTAKLALIGGSGESSADQAYAQAIRQRIVTAGLDQRVVLTGHVEPSDVSGYLLAADAIVLPFVDGYSYRRGSLIAALTHGIPVITTHAPAGVSQAPLPELRDGQDVLLIAPNDSEALGMAMQRITNDHELALRLARNGRWLSDTFGWDRIAQQHVDIYTAIR
jgi:glycosyltransferase involved in cell wall biosynthesis